MTVTELFQARFPFLTYPEVIIADVRELGKWTGETQYESAQGCMALYDLHAELLTQPAGEQLILLTVKDKTREKAALTALKESEQSLQRSQQLSKIGHWEMDVRTMALKGTDELYEIFGLPKGAPFRDFDAAIHPDDREGAVRIIENTLKNGGKYDSTYRIVTPENAIKWVHAIGESVFSENGRFVNIAGSVQDISSLKKVEEELFTMQKLKSLGVLAGGIAHDFNNIHTMVFGNISLALSKMQENHPGYQDLMQADKAINRATNLSNQLLTFAKGGNPVKSTIALDVLIKELLELDLAGSKVKLELDVLAPSCLVDADRGQMEQVFTNLVINAAQAMTEGGHLFIKIETAEFKEQQWSLKPGQYIHVQIRDEGGGIKEEHIDQIFDPYFSTKDTGNGLGLATVYSIINRHGGRINVSSTLGEGATFDIYLPASSDVLTYEARQAVITEAEVLHGKVLVLDDEPMLCELACKILEKEGFQVDYSYGSADALARYQQAIAQQTPYDCVIMDLTIPGDIGGKEVVQEVLKIHPEARVIVSSGYAEDQVMANYTDYGFKGAMPKPYKPATKLKIIGDVLKGS